MNTAGIFLFLPENSTIRWHSIRLFNPCPAEPGYALSLQTV